jgi:predicted transglutaminase-like cysteine proteinase
MPVMVLLLLSASLAEPAAAAPSSMVFRGSRAFKAPSYAAVGGVTSIPFGWLDFCHRYSGECDGGPLEPLDIVLAPNAAKELDRVNLWVNAHVEPVTDMEHYGVADLWTYPTDGKGDCEAYALLKRKILIDEGFPRQALLITVVRDQHDEGHAVLTAKTNAGDLILDNLTTEVKPWDRTGYRFVKRQSQRDQNVWVEISDGTQVPD